MNISQNVERAAKFFPEKFAIVFEGTRIPYGDLNARVNRLANGLKANKVGREACVALYLPNIPEDAGTAESVVRMSIKTRATSMSTGSRNFSLVYTNPFHDTMKHDKIPFNVTPVSICTPRNLLAVPEQPLERMPPAECVSSPVGGPGHCRGFPTSPPVSSS